MHFISLTHQNQTFQSPPFSEQNSSMSLMQFCQMPCNELKNVTLVLNEHQEIMIQTTANTALVIERYGRKRQCNADHPLMLFKNDILWVGEKKLRFEIQSICLRREPASRISKLARNTLVASAAALAMAAVPACHSATQTPPNDTVTEVPQDNNTNKVQEPAGDTGVESPAVDPKDFPLPMGIPPIKESAPPPRVIGKVPMPPEEMENHEDQNQEDSEDNVEQIKPQTPQNPPRIVGKPPANNDTSKDRPRPMGTPKY